MFQVLFALQIIGIVVLLAEIFYMIPRISGKSQVLMLLFVVETFIDCVGYFLVITSTDKATALMGTKILYMGRAYLLLTMFVYVMQFCRVRLPKQLVAILSLFQTFILALVLFSEHTTLYYASIGFDNSGFVPHLVLGKGVMYVIYQIITLLYFISMFVVLTARMMTTKSKREKKKIIVLLTMLAICAVSLCCFFIGITGGYDTLGFGEIISAVIFLFGIFRFDMLSTIDTARAHIVDNMETGVVMVDDSDDVIYSNAIITSIFPQLLSDEGGCIAEIEKACKTGDKIFCGERVYMAVKEDSKNHGKVYTLPNITTTYNYMGRLEREINEKTAKLRMIQSSIIANFANIVETRDGFTGQHIRNTSQYVEIIARKLQKSIPDRLSVADVELMVDAAPLHDIGKISIPDSILCKAGRLTAEEESVMKSHSEVGANIISDMIKEVGSGSYLETARDMAYYHHERWDGSGYPCGLKGEEIPLSARIMAVADVYDALRSRRCYKEGMSKEQSLAIIKEGAGTQFDPDVVAAFVKDIVKIERVSPTN